jgi:methionine--tRNA ligase beta chain
MSDQKPEINYDQFSALDLRIGEVIAASEPEWSRKLLELRVNLGAEVGERTIFTGIRQWYAADDLIGKKYVFVVNLAPKKMGESQSHGMLMMADGPERPVLLPVASELEVGTTVR